MTWIYKLYNCAVQEFWQFLCSINSICVCNNCRSSSVVDLDYIWGFHKVIISAWVGRFRFAIGIIISERRACNIMGCI
jgi:hypothetical protein